MTFLFIKLLIFVAIVAVEVSANRRFGIEKCPKGWLQFEHTCYFRQPDFMNFDEAVKNCERREAKLFDFDDSFEFEAVRRLFPDYYFTWVKAEIEEELEWLYEPYEETINGKNSVAKCIAYYSSPVKATTTTIHAHLVSIRSARNHWIRSINGWIRLYIFQSIIYE